MHKTKLLAVFIILLNFSQVVFAQTRQVPNLLYFDNAKYHFGFLLGVNEMLFTVKTVDNYQFQTYYNNATNLSMPDLNCDSANLYRVEGTSSFGFVIGIIGNMRMGNYFDLRFTPSLTFGERNLVYDLKTYTQNEPPKMLLRTKNIQSTFIDFPLWVRFKGDRIHNIRPYVFAGAKYSIDLASNAKKKDNSNIAHVFIDKNDFYALGGVGFDFYTAYFKFGTELSMSYGFFDVLKRDETIYTKGISKLQSKIFQISFTFE